MTAYFFAGNNSYLGEWKEIEDNLGYPDYIQEVIIEDQILPTGALVYVKDRGLDDWHLAKFDVYKDEVQATLVKDDEGYGSSFWRYVLFPDAIITDIDKMPAANILEAKEKEKFNNKY